MTSREKENGRELFYRYIPKRALIVDSVFLIVLTTAGILLLEKGVWPLALVMGIVVLNTLKDMVRESVIELWSEPPYVIYIRKSILGKESVEIPSWEIAGATTHIKSMWKGNISEKLVLETSGKEYLLQPNYSRNDPVTADIHSHLSSLRDQGNEIREKQLLEEKQKKLYPHGKPRKKKVKKLVWGMLEMSIKCPGCEAPVPVNGPWTDLHCTECSESIELTPDNWADLLEDVRNEIAYEIEPGTGSESTIMGVFDTHVLYSRMVPYCRECKEDLHNPEPGAEKLVCSCGASLPLTKPPGWFKRVFGGVRYIAGATRSTEAMAEKPESVSITCTSCGASFDVSGETRNPSCPHCKNAVFLPDDLWHHFHPVPVKKRWFVGFKASFVEEES